MNNPENTVSGRMTIKKLTLHRETVQELVGSRDGALSASSGTGNGNTCYLCTLACTQSTCRHGRTCNKHC